MKCQACGANVPEGSRFCNRCGAPAVPYAVPPGQYPGQIPYAPYPPPAKKDDDKAVLVLVVLVIVAVIVLPIILAGVLYFMVVGFGEDYNTTTPLTVLTRTSFAYGVKFTFGPPTSDVTWTDVSIILSDGLESVSWHDSNAYDLTSAEGAVTWHCDYPKQLTPISVWFNITDIAGNGMMNAGDFFTFTTGSSQTFSISVTYAVTIMFEPTGAMMTGASFVG